MIKKILTALMVLGLTTAVQAKNINHFNMGYTTGTSKIPLNINDRYYSQDLGRDHWFGMDKIGQAIEDITGSTGPFLVSGASVTQLAGTNNINISSGSGYALYFVTLPMSFASLPPTTTTQAVEMIQIPIGQVSYNIASGSLPAKQDGSSNYIKVQYYDAPAATRSYALKSGSYFYEMSSSYTLTVDTVPPIAGQIILGTLTSTGTNAPMTLSYSARTSSFSTLAQLKTNITNNTQQINGIQQNIYTIVSTNIATGQFVTIASSVSTASSGASGTAVGNVTSADPGTGGGTNLVMGQVCLHINDNGGAHYAFNVYISKDGSAISGAISYFGIDGLSAGTFSDTCGSVYAVDFQASGSTRQYSLLYQVTDGTFSSVKSFQLHATQFKRN